MHKIIRHISREHFYDQRTSYRFIEYKLKQIRLEMNPEQKKTKTLGRWRDSTSNRLHRHRWNSRQRQDTRDGQCHESHCLLIIFNWRRYRTDHVCDDSAGRKCVALQKVVQKNEGPRFRSLSRSRSYYIPVTWTRTSELRRRLILFWYYSQTSL